jgi:beta-N-acetylglucosaminidase
MVLDLLKFEKKIFSIVRGSSTGAQWTVKNESHLCTKKNTLFYSEFDADSEYVTLFENYFGQKNGLIDTCPFYHFGRRHTTHDYTNNKMNNLLTERHILLSRHTTFVKTIYDSIC